MPENLPLTLLKLLLLASIAVLLLLIFIAHNDTQSKIIVTAQKVDALADQVSEIRRQLSSGVAVGVRTDTRVEPGTTKARIPGFIPTLSTERDRERAPDAEIDFDAELRTASLSEPKGFNIYTSDRDQFVINLVAYYVCPPLAERKDANKDEFKPGLAEHVEVSPDRLEYHIWIRPGVYWQRPPVDLTDPSYAWMRGKHEVTAEDLELSLSMILNERADTQQVRPDYRDVEDFQAVDRYHFQVRWKKPSFYSTGVLLGGLRPLPRWIYTVDQDGVPVDEASLGQHFAAHWFNKLMCGYGSYRFAEYKKSDYVLLERNEAYWGRRPGFKTIRYKLALRDDDPRYNLFMRTDANGNREQDAYPMSATRLKRDVLDNDGSSKLRRQLSERRLFIHRYVRPMYAYTGWACRSKYFRDPRTRRAMTLAANREAWPRDILLGQAVFGTGIAFVLSPEYDATIEPWPYDLDEAARLLTEVGWVDADGNGVREKTIDGEVVELRFKHLMGSGGGPEIEAMQRDWGQSLQKIGVIMEPEFAEWSLFTKKVEDRECDAWSMAWYHSDDFKPDGIFHSRLIADPGSYNFGEWSHPRADEIMDQLFTEFDLDRRYALCHELHRIVHEEQPYTILWTWQNSVCWDSCIGGYDDPRPFTPAISWLDVYKLKKPPAPYDDDRYELPQR